MIAMQTPVHQLREMKLPDLAAAVELSSGAGWNQTAEDWLMLLNLSPSGCFAIEVGGQLAATTTIVCYQQRLAWIGMVLTGVEYRRRGFARRLVKNALDYADSLGIETVKLDATAQGRAIYETFGFQAEQPIERWSRPDIEKIGVFGNSSTGGEYSRDLDSRGFGVDRSDMLDQLARRSNTYTNAGASLLARAGRVAAYLGPSVATDPAAARAVVTDCVSASPDISWYWDILPDNRNAVALAADLGFARQRQLTRMARGKPLRERTDMTYAIAGFELG